MRVWPAHLVLFLLLSQAAPSEQFFGEIWNGVKKVSGVLSKAAENPLVGNLIKAIPVVGPAVHTGLGVISSISSVNAVGKSNELKKEAISKRLEPITAASDDYLAAKARGDEVAVQRLKKVVANRLKELNTDNNLFLNKMDLKIGDLLSNTQKSQESSAKAFERLNSVGETDSKNDANIEALLTQTEKANSLSIQALNELGGVSSRVDTISSFSEQIIDLQKDSLVSYEQLVDLIGQGNDETQNQLHGIDDDLVSLKLATDSIDGSVAAANRQLGSLLALAGDIDNKISESEIEVIDQIRSSTKLLDKSLNTMGDSIKVGIAEVSQRVDEFGEVLETGFGNTEMAISDLSSVVSENFKSTKQNIMDGWTLDARECFRNLMDAIDGNNGIQLLLRPFPSTRNEKSRIERILTRLDNPNTGVERCIEHYKALYDPAQLGNEQDIFSRLRENFLLAFKNQTEWVRMDAQAELRGLHLIMHRLVLQVSNLYTVNAAHISAKSMIRDAQDRLAGLESFDNFDVLTPSLSQVSTYDSRYQLDKSSQDMADAISMIVEAFDENFPACGMSNVLNEATGSFRVYCNTDRVSIPNILPKKCEEAPAFSPECQQDEGFVVGTECKFECYADDMETEGSTLAQPLVCGPLGGWSRPEEVIIEDFHQCNRLVTGVVIRQKVDVVSKQVDSGFSSLQQDVASLVKSQNDMLERITNQMKTLHEAIDRQSGTSETRFAALTGDLQDLKSDTDVLNSELDSLQNDFTVLQKESEVCSLTDDFESGREGVFTPYKSFHNVSSETETFFAIRSSGKTDLLLGERGTKQGAYLAAAGTLLNGKLTPMTYQWSIPPRPKISQLTYDAAASVKYENDPFEPQEEVIRWEARVSGRWVAFDSLAARKEVDFIGQRLYRDTNFDGIGDEKSIWVNNQFKTLTANIPAYANMIRVTMGSSYYGELLAVDNVIVCGSAPILESTPTDSQQEEKPAAFSVFSVQGAGQANLKFDKIHYDADRGWNATSQNFVAQRKGVYFFTLTMSREGPANLRVLVQKTNPTGVVSKFMTFSDKNDSERTQVDGTHSVSAVWSLNKGDNVSVKYVGGIFKCTNDYVCSFSGFKLND